MAAAPVTIVTAAGKGIGAAVARELADRGHLLVLTSNSGGAETLAPELGAIGMTGSVADEAHLAAVVERAVAEHGRIDAVVNNTGHPAKGPLLELSNDDWRAGLELVLLNVITMARLVTPVMERSGHGAIVNVSTFSAFEPSLTFPISSALRAALGAFTKLYADQYAVAGIRMNCVLPGFMDSYPESAENLQRIPMGRYGAVGELAKTVAFLLSDDAGYITGQNLRVDGGLSHSV